MSETKEIYGKDATTRERTEQNHASDTKSKETPGQSAKAKEEKHTLILERKLRALNNADSIFILPFAREGFKMAHMSRAADKLMSTVKRKFGVTVDVKQAKEIFRDFEDFAGMLWKFVFKLSPNLHSIQSKDWRRVNDPVEVKKTIAFRRASIVIEPRSEESAQIAMAVKIIQQKNIELRQTSTFEELEKFVKEYAKILIDFDEILGKAATKLGEDYRPFMTD
jgi:hypothetical protein